MIRWHAVDGDHGAVDPLRRTYRDESGPRVNPSSRGSTATSPPPSLDCTLRSTPPRSTPRSVRSVRSCSVRAPPCPCSTARRRWNSASTSPASMPSICATCRRPPPTTPSARGRAGRSGQPALVTTYCATGNSHDQYYFRRPEQMVAGTVAPPRLDLGNEDLLAPTSTRSGSPRPGSNCTRTMTGAPRYRTGENPSLELLPLVAQDIDNPAARRRALAARPNSTGRLRRRPARHLLVARGVAGADRSDRPRAVSAGACGRWKNLFRRALEEREIQHEQHPRPHRHRPLQGPGQAPPGAGREPARAARQRAGRRAFGDVRLLPVPLLRVRGLPARLLLPPAAARRLYPGHRRTSRGGYDGDYLQRSRFIAIREFGPGALIYHEGARYKVDRVQLPPDTAGELTTESAKVCGRCGYLSPEELREDTCAACNSTLGDARTGLLHLHTVFTRRRDRISSDEEERQRTGYKVEISYRFKKHEDGRDGSLRAAARAASGTALAELAYGDSATVRLTNLGYRRSVAKGDIGFWMDPVTGEWLAGSTSKQGGRGDPRGAGGSRGRRQGAAQGPCDPVRARTPGTSSSSSWRSPSTGTPRSLSSTPWSAASRRCSSWRTPSSTPRSCRLSTVRVSVCCSSRAPRAAPVCCAVFRRSRTPWPARPARPWRSPTSIRWDATGERSERNGDPCEKGCYDCLLSFGNQRHHRSIDRKLVADLLQAFASGTVEGSAVRAAARRRARRRPRRGRATPIWRARFVELADITRPPAAGPTSRSRSVEALSKPDFVYDTGLGPVAVFVDGPRPRRRRDHAARRRGRRASEGHRLGRRPAVRRRLARGLGRHRAQPVIAASTAHLRPIAQAARR